MVAADEFSELLGRLKERSGLSYGVLGKRLHTSASTLHRYVNGDAVPTDYAPVERFARACKASPEELVELHRWWVLADARRRQKAGGTAAEEEPRARPAAEGRAGAAEAGNGTAGSGTAGSGTAGSGTAGSGPGVPESGRAGSGTAGSGTAGPEAAEAADPANAADQADEAVPEAGPRPLAEARGPLARRRTAVLAGAAVTAALVSAALVVSLVPGEGDDGRGGKQSVGAASRSADSVGKSPAASGSADAKGRSASPSASRSGSPTAPASASATRSGAAGGGGSEGGAPATAPAVAVNPYKWEEPCGQHYLVDEKPERMPPPPSEPDARGWVTALGGVAAGQQMLTLTVQGTGKATVVLEDLHVRVVEKSAPLAWNDFDMGVGCGGGVETTAFGVDLDAGRPALSPKAGQRDFPYTVSESDPEAFFIFADARTHNVSWYLELDWSSGDQKGTVRIDDNGKPFRTSGNVGRPAYTYPLGSSEWGRNEYEPNIPG